MRNLIKIAIILLLVIGSLLFILGYYLEKNLPRTDLSSSQKNILQLESLLPKEEEDEEEEEEIQYLGFNSPDKKLKFIYLSDWVETKDKKFLGNIFSKEIAEKYDLNVLFLALKTTEQSIFQLVVSEGTFSNQRDSGEIINIIEEDREKRGWTKEDINLETEDTDPEIEDNKDTFEARYEKDNTVLHLKEKVVLLTPEEEETKVYFVTFSSPEENWQNLEGEIEEIISSIQIAN